MHTLINADCLDCLRGNQQTWTSVFADPPDNIGLGYQTYKDKLHDEQYVDLLQRWLDCFIHKARTVWFSYNARWTFEVGRIVSDMLKRTPGLEAKPCTQTFTFGQHNHRDLGNNHRPLLRLRWFDAPLLPDAIRVPSWRQENGDRRADPRGRVPGDVMHSESRGRDTLPLPRWAPRDVERFLRKIDRRSETECWEWIAGKESGYGRFRIGGRNGKTYIATRLMWRLVHGTDPAGQLILHTCDNRACCNPAHLFIGSDTDNSRDREAKGRGNHARGQEHGLTILTDEDVVRIYQSSESYAALGRRYGVSDVTIRNIREGKTWQHVTGDLTLSDVFNFPRVTGNSKQRRPWHPTQLNEGLVERCIKLTTPPGESVLDPFGGTGTTLRVCRRLSHPCTLIEIDEDYCARIAAEHGMKQTAYIHRALWEVD
jgi:hypothetical protein